MVKNVSDTVYLYKEQLETVDVSYSLNDFIRLKFYFFSNFEVFYFMHISNFLMSTNSYNLSGSLHRGKLFRELNRMMTLAKIIDYNDEKGLLKHVRNNAPNVESKLDWERYFDDTLILMNSDEFRNQVNNWKYGEIIGKNSGLDESQLSDSFDDMYEILMSSRDITDFKKFWHLCYVFISDLKPMTANAPSYLARTWSNGEGIKVSENNVIDNLNTVQNRNSESYFLIDPQGGIFFYDNVLSY